MTRLQLVGAAIDAALIFGAASAALLAGLGSALVITAGYRTGNAISRHTRRIPAAPDNQPGTNPELLWECRRIHALPTTRKEDHS